MTSISDWLDTIAHTARLLPDIVEGQPISVANLHKAAAVSGWITDAPQADQDIITEACTIDDPEHLAAVGRAYLALAIQRHQEQQETTK